MAGLAQASSADQQAGANDAVKALEWKLDAARLRFSKLVGILNAHLEPAARKKVLNALGRECARSHAELINKYRGNVEGFLEEGRRQWMESATYDAKAGTIRIVDRSKKCTCPLVKLGETPGEFCDCTLGWQEEAYSAILGRPVTARLEESVLRGGRSCAFVIEVA